MLNTAAAMPIFQPCLLASSKASLALFSICFAELSKEVAHFSPLIGQYCIAFLLVSFPG